MESLSNASITLGQQEVAVAAAATPGGQASAGAMVVADTGAGGFLFLGKIPRSR